MVDVIVIITGQYKLSLGSKIKRWGICFLAHFFFKRKIIKVLLKKCLILLKIRKIKMYIFFFTNRIRIYTLCKTFFRYTDEMIANIIDLIVKKKVVKMVLNSTLLLQFYMT